MNITYFLVKQIPIEDMKYMILSGKTIKRTIHFP